MNDMTKTTGVKSRDKIVKSCKCNIFGIVSLVNKKNDMYYKIDPIHYNRTLKKFKYCPICGKLIREVQND